MVACKRCNVSNSLDSKFCRQCGASLPDDELQKAAEELEALIAEGFHAFNEGRTEEAALIAASAIESNPSAGSALSLRGMCHERQGELAEALECYEKVVALNPDSALDKIKITQLRNQLAGRASTLEPPDRKRALLGALAAVVLVVALGSIAAVLTGGQPEERLASNEGADTQLQGFQVGPPGVAQTTPQPGADAPAGTPGPPGTQPPASDVRLPSLGTPNGTPVLPPVGPEGFSNPLPVQPSGPIGEVGVRPTGDSVRDRQTGSVGMDPVDPVLRPPSINPQAPPKEDTGVIDIRVSSSQAPTGGSSSGSNGLEALSRAARQQYQLGKFADAARSYEQLLRNGGDAASTNQRLGQCYEKLGRKPEAVSAYTRAIAAYDSQVKGGKADAQIALDACRQALKILQGG